MSNPFGIYPGIYSIIFESKFFFFKVATQFPNNIYLKAHLYLNLLIILNISLYFPALLLP